MISLDSTRAGNMLMLRESMVKFQGSDSHEIEVCGSGINPLPLYLNRQNIKLLEDLGVSPRSFLELQQEEIDRLRHALRSPLHAAEFVAEANIAKSTKLSWLIGILGRLGLSFSNDDFLRQAIELTVLIKLHELKYRARIPVKDGVTLYGIMDETGFLKEDEIYCPIETEADGRRVLVRNNTVITRSPALHPGDIQLVNAVDVPEDCPLNSLHNCVVFSQKGLRDLPSKLSGGDLDGDLYNIIYDERLKPKRCAIPADYPRVEAAPLPRPVGTRDIIDHFLVFMQQDQLGRIATIHQVLADRKPQGTLDPDCLLLAELHSQAVDFSKTGIPVSDTLRSTCCFTDSDRLTYHAFLGADQSGRILWLLGLG